MLLCSFTTKKTGSVFPSFCRSTFHHAYITAVTYCERGTIAKIYHARDKFDFSQGRVTKNQPMAVPVLVE